MKRITYPNQRPIHWRQVAVEATTLLCIALFVYAGLAKLLAYEKTAMQLARSPLLSNHASFIAWFVPASELLIAGLMGWPKTRLVGLYAFLALMIAFTAYIAHTLYFSGAVPCSCGGALERLTWGQHLVFNGGFIAVAAVSIALQRRIHNIGTKRKEAIGNE